MEHQVVVPGGQDGDDGKEETRLSMMAMTAETFNFVACSIATLASAFATGNFKSRSPSWEVRASDELEIKKELTHAVEVLGASHWLAQASTTW